MLPALGCSRPFASLMRVVLPLPLGQAAHDAAKADVQVYIFQCGLILLVALGQCFTAQKLIHCDPPLRPSVPKARPPVRDCSRCRASFQKIRRQRPGGVGAKLFDQCSILRNIAACSAFGAHQSFRLQLGKGPLHRVWVHPGGCGQITYRIQMPARRVGAGQDPGLQPFHKLGIDRAAGIKLFAHGIISLSCCIKRLIQ